MQDIQSAADIKILVNTFYDAVKTDDTIGYIFQEIIGDDWSHHLPVMYQFWETVLLNNAGYTGNPIKKHVAIDQQTPLTAIHYEQWLALWTKTVDALFSGTIADTAKQRAQAMMQLISMKVQWARDGKSVL